jgi:hypothetical protein
VSRELTIVQDTSIGPKPDETFDDLNQKTHDDMEFLGSAPSADLEQRGSKTSSDATGTLRQWQVVDYPNVPGSPKTSLDQLPTKTLLQILDALPESSCRACLALSNRRMLEKIGKGRLRLASDQRMDLLTRMAQDGVYKGQILCFYCQKFHRYAENHKAPRGEETNASQSSGTKEGRLCTSSTDDRVWLKYMLPGIL